MMSACMQYKTNEDTRAASSFCLPRARLASRAIYSPRWENLSGSPSISGPWGVPS